MLSRRLYRLDNSSSWLSLDSSAIFFNKDVLILEDDVTFSDNILKEFKVVKLINAYRTRGHLFTKTNPVRNRRPYRPTLELQNFGLDKNDLESVFNAGSILGLQPTKLSDIINHLEPGVLMV